MSNEEKRISNSELYYQRAKGTLPHIDIDGTDFTIDWDLRELRETEFPWNRIDILDMGKAEDGENYLFFYDTKELNIWPYDPTITAPPENVVVAKIPYELRLDPYAVAKEKGHDLVDYIKPFPMDNNLKATISPLSESGLPHIIEQNLKNRNLRDDDYPLIKDAYRKPGR